ncbi:helix-turn-helix protein [Chryseobacterium oranimense G311]|uniref:helix-turn-helix domain-containing protein n=1 Tax=Chryseobacterium oranimense TaxID=421058 RepID=UPI000533AA28|nr:helix-turn-helix domain-containing protein [Chryseobacterium oranimense]CEJ70551.1 helix-turn-helix protein [Chryseobacterium oranimense G311]DAG72820.1 MAG TPA: putative transcriptional regulator [Caudoviricetes sp.]
MNALEIKEFRKIHNLSQEDLAKITESSLRTVRSWEYGERNISKSALKILQVYTQSGGNLLKNDSTETSIVSTRSNVKQKTYPSALEVKLVTTKARAGFTDSYYSEEYLKDLPSVIVEADKEYKGNYLAFEVDGDSMENEYFAGDIVICREIKRDLWQYKLHYKDYDFVIAHGTQGIMLKEITDHNTETGEIVCHSLNQYNDKNKDFILNLKEVAFLYNVVEHRRSGKSKRQNR